MEFCLACSVENHDCCQMEPECSCECQYQEDFSDENKIERTKKFDDAIRTQEGLMLAQKIENLKTYIEGCLHE